MDTKGTIPRESVSTIEVWSECFERDRASIKKSDGYETALILKRLGWAQEEKRRYIPWYGQQCNWRRCLDDEQENVEIPMF